MCNVIVIVTRYFGGILLGTGGLVRAYSEATIKAIEEIDKIKCCKGYELELTLEYSDFENFRYYCNKNNINILNSEYNENINIKIELNEEAQGKMMQYFETKNINIKNLKKLSEKYIKINKWKFSFCKKLEKIYNFLLQNPSWNNIIRIVKN